MVGAASATVAVIGAIIGGCAGGLLWTAQGAYYTDNATLYVVVVVVVVVVSIVEVGVPPRVEGAAS